MITWDEHKIFIIIALVILLLILLDEWALHAWKRANPGHIYSHLFDKRSLPLVDPTNPPTTTIYE